MAGHRMVFESVYKMVGNDAAELRALKADHEMLLAKLNAMTFHDAGATFGHLARAIVGMPSPRLIAQALHYGLRVTYHKARLILKPATRR
jgi:hypothetical protein